MKAATYVRLSASRLGDEAPGLDRQREAIQRLARDRGWLVEEQHQFRDADTSAFRPGVPRPGFAALERAVEAGEVGAVIVWKMDRAFRRLREAVEFLELCKERRVAFVSVTEGLDTTSPFGPVLFALFVSLAQLESQTRSDRTRAWHQQRAERGEPVGGGSRPFGYKAGGLQLEPAEARLVRAAVRRMLVGRATFTGIARDWNSAGVATPPGRRWSKGTVRRMLLSPRIAGLREHGGQTYPARWRPLITEEQHLRLRALFPDGTREPAGRRYLLTGGLAVCGHCGVRLVARPKADGRRCYVCATDQGGCGKIRALAAELEEHVASEVSRRASERGELGDGEPATPRDSDAESLRAQLAADESALEDLARDRYVTRSITEAEFRAARDPLAERVAATQAAIASTARRSRRSWRDPDFWQRREPWDAEPGTDPDPDALEAWREWVAEDVERVVVGPAVRGRNRFDPGRVTIEWRGADEDSS